MDIYLTWELFLSIVVLESLWIENTISNNTTIELKAYYDIIVVFEYLIIEITIFDNLVIKLIARFNITRPDIKNDIKKITIR